MNKGLRHVVFVLLACFTMLFIQTNRVQVFDAGKLQDNPANTRTFLKEFDRPRAAIVTRDGVVVAVSEPISGSQFDLQRRYPEGELYAHSVGYASFTVGAEGIERTYNDEIIGKSLTVQLGERLTI